MTNSFAVLLFGAFAIAVEAGVILLRGQGWGPQAVRIVGLSLVVTASLFLAVSGSERAGAAYALLGVLAGYLVGRTEGKAGEG